LPICDARELFVGVSGMNFAGHMSLERGIHFALFCRRDGSVSIVTKLLQEPFDGTGAAKRTYRRTGTARAERSLRSDAHPMCNP
jgi:hypothetical protein